MRAEHGWASIEALWDYADPVGSERRFRGALASPPSPPSPAGAATSAAHAAELWSQVARALVLQRRYDDGHAALDRAEALLAADGVSSPRARARCLLERGRLWNDAGDPTAARACFAHAWELSTSAPGLEALAVDVAHMFGVSEPPSEAAGWNRRAIALALSNPDPRVRRWLGSLYSNLGHNLLKLDAHDDAAAAFERARVEREALGDARRARWARIDIARALRLGGRVAEALERQQALLAETRAAGEADGYAAEEVAECLLALGRGDEARALFARAHAVLSRDPWFPPTESARLARLARLGGA